MASSKHSAGLMMYRRTGAGLEVFLVHPGGPFFARKNEGAWSIPKGERGPDEDPLEVARREFAEETGQAVEACTRGGRLIPLGTIRQRNGKLVDAWAFEGDWPAGAVLRSNTFTVVWPPGSGARREFPEVDRGEFVPLAEARRRLNPAQVELIERLVRALETR